MLYDYLLTQFYPKIFQLVCLHLFILLIVTGVFFICMPVCGTKEEKENYKKKWMKKLICIWISQIGFLMFYAWIPDAEYVRHYYGEARQGQEAKQQQLLLEQTQKRLERQERATKAFEQCLEKGQKQPGQVVFNDTNEVVKTCRKYANDQR